MIEAKDEHVFETLDALYLWVKEGEFYQLHPGLLEFHNAYEMIPKGCGCNKKKRINYARACYVKLKDLPLEISMEFKRLLVAKKIVLKHDGIVLGYIGP